MFDLATNIVVKKKDKINLPSVAKPQEVETIYINGESGRICPMPYYKDMKVRAGMQTNEKAEYLYYLRPDQPWLPQEARISWTFRNKNFSGAVKFTKPKGIVNLGYDKECYIVSDNE
jgi:hypothetical protein